MEYRFFAYLQRLKHYPVRPVVRVRDYVGSCPIWATYSRVMGVRPSPPIFHPNAQRVSTFTWCHGASISTKERRTTTDCSCSIWSYSNSTFGSSTDHCARRNSSWSYPEGACFVQVKGVNKFLWSSWCQFTKRASL